MLDNKAAGKKQFAVLIDPDRIDDKNLTGLVEKANGVGVDYFYVGGSLVVDDRLNEGIHIIKNNSSIPVIIFPGSPLQITCEADAIFFLSLISGRNAELLIGQHVISAPGLKKSGLEIIPTGYILVDGGKPTAVSYMSNSTPIPADKNEIAMCTAMAGSMLGLKAIYMDAGSGAQNPITTAMIKLVSDNVNLPLIVGGGIKTPEKAIENCEAGADIIVVGDAIENDASLLSDMSIAIHSISKVER